jgi:hypothetical protein
VVEDRSDTEEWNAHGDTLSAPTVVVPTDPEFEIPVPTIPVAPLKRPRPPGYQRTLLADEALPAVLAPSAVPVSPPAVRTVVEVETSEVVVRRAAPSTERTTPVDAADDSSALTDVEIPSVHTAKLSDLARRDSAPRPGDEGSRSLAVIAGVLGIVTLLGLVTLGTVFWLVLMDPDPAKTVGTGHSSTPSSAPAASAPKARPDDVPKEAVAGSMDAGQEAGSPGVAALGGDRDTGSGPEAGAGGGDVKSAVVPPPAGALVAGPGSAPKTSMPGPGGNTVPVTSVFVRPGDVRESFVYRGGAYRRGAWGVVRVGGVDTLVVPDRGEGTVRERTQSLTQMLAQVGMAYGEAKGGQFLIVGIEDTPYLVWKAPSGKGNPRALEVMALDARDLSALRRFESSESLERRWASLPDRLNDILDVVVLGRTPSRVKARAWVEAADEWADHPDKLDNKTLGALNRAAWRTP